MSAQATITAPRREDYEPNVRAFLPTAEGEELQLRASLLLMRDRAVATKPIASETGWHLLDLVERTATRYAFWPMALADLRELRRLLLNTVCAASGFDGLFSAPEMIVEEREGG